MRRSWACFEAGDVFFKSGVLAGREELILRCFRGFYFCCLGKSKNRRKFLRCGFSCLGSWEPFPSFSCSFWTLLSPLPVLGRPSSSRSWKILVELLLPRLWKLVCNLDQGEGPDNT